MRISPLSSSNSTRGERACTRAITSARVVQAGFASTLRRALGTSVSAAASRMPAPPPKATNSNDATVVEAKGKLTR
jgi:hypothetical protein